MFHVCFDLDGTLIDSVKLDTAWFLTAVRNVVGDIPVDLDWSAYARPTDSGIVRTIADGLAVDGEELEAEVRSQFIAIAKKSLASRDQILLPIPGATEFLSSVIRDRDFCVSVATAGWTESAKLKMEHVGLSDDLPLAASEDGTFKADIILAAEQKALNRMPRPVRRFQHRIYFGDSRTDEAAALSIGYTFVAIAGGDYALGCNSPEVHKDYLSITPESITSLASD